MSGCKGCSKYSDLIVVQDPRSARFHDNLLKPDPGSPGSSKIFSVRDARSLGSHGSITVTVSNIFRIPRENENIGFEIPPDPGSWILDPGDPGYRIFWGSWHLSARNRIQDHDTGPVHNVGNGVASLR